MKKIFSLGLLFWFLLVSCDKDDDQKYYKPAGTGGTMELQGGEGGVMAVNSVYVDLSTDQQVSIRRTSWNLALHSGSAFGVKLNNTTGSRAIEAAAGITTSTVISESDHNGYLLQLAPSMGGDDFTTADQIASDTNLSGTVIKKDKVYIYCSDETAKLIYKVSVSEKNSTTYTVSYALWNSQKISTLDVAKDNNYSFVGVSFVLNKKVDVQPTKNTWDIVWGRSTYSSAMAVGVPFVISDLVFLNTKAGVQAQEVMISQTVNYNNFTAANLTQIKLSSDVDVVGSKWRNGGGPSTAPSAKTDRFYVVKDVQGNIYKLGFVSMNDGEDGGKRGYPEIKYALLVEAK